MRLLRVAIILLLTGAALTPGGAAPAEKNISLDLNDADLRQVLDGIMRGAGVNYVFADKVEGKVTAVLENVPFEQALEVVLSSSGYESVPGEFGYTIRKRPAPTPPAAATVPAPAGTSLAPSAGSRSGQPASGTEKQTPDAAGGLPGALGEANGQQGPGAPMDQQPYGMGWGPQGGAMPWGAQMPGAGYPPVVVVVPQGYGMPPYYPQMGNYAAPGPNWPMPFGNRGFGGFMPSMNAPILNPIGSQWGRSVFTPLGGQGSMFTPLGGGGW